MVAVLSQPPAPDGSELRDLATRADALEVRADLAGDPDPRWLRQHYPGTLIYALRTLEEGGHFSGDPAVRHTRLLAAARAYDQVDLECARDLTPELLAAVPAGRRRLSRHLCQPAGVETLAAFAARMTETPAASYVLSSDAPAAEDAAAAVAFLMATQRRDLTAFATGAAGLWTRVLAPRLGAPVVFGEVGASSQAGLPTLAQLQTDYGFPELRPAHCLYGIIGRSVSHSASPRLHNRAYRMLGVPAVYVPFPTQDIERFWRIVIPALDAAGLPLRGLSLTPGFKDRVIGLVERPSETAVRCGAANVVWRDGDVWAADTADTAVVAALAARGIDPRGQRAAVVGCGAAGRSVAAALARAGAEVCLVNRSGDRGQFAGRLLSLPFVPLAEFSPVGFTLLVHATPATDRLALPLSGLAKDATVVELAYANATTPLIREARMRGLSTMDGWDVLAAQAARQFQLMTGLTMPPGIAIDRPVPFRADDHSLREESL